VTGRSGFSVQTLSVLAALCAEPAGWRHGYGIAKDIGLKSGSLYPILIRLSERGLVEARWEEEQSAGRPRRHLYRLTPGGLAAARTALAEQAASQHHSASAAGGRRVAEEGA
jgi:PadR family transcriptional regulator, regulatory protein PadR